MMNKLDNVDEYKRKEVEHASDQIQFKGEVYEWEQVMQDIYEGLKDYAKTEEGKQLKEILGEKVASHLRKKGLELFQKLFE